jgi:hypothetical protein
MNETDREHENERRDGAAHEFAAVVHDQAAEKHEEAREYFDEHGEPGQAQRERDVADREARKSVADRRDAPAREDR